MWQDIKPTLKNCLQSFTGAWFICLIITMLSVAIPWGKLKATHQVASYFVSDSLVFWRLNYLQEIMRISGANEKLYKLVAVTTDFYCANISKVVTLVVFYESMPIIQDLLGNGYPEVEPEWVGAIKKSVSNSSLGDLLDLNSEPPALEEVLGGSSAAATLNQSGRVTELSAVNARYQQQVQQQQQGRDGVAKDWHVFDPVFGVIEAKTLEKWKREEQEAIAKATYNAPERRQRVLPPVRGTSPLSTPNSSPMSFKKGGVRKGVDGNSNGNDNDNDRGSGNGNRGRDGGRLYRGSFASGSSPDSALEIQCLGDERDSFDSISAPPSF